MLFDQDITFWELVDRTKSKANKVLDFILRHLKSFRDLRVVKTLHFTTGVMGSPGKLFDFQISFEKRIPCHEPETKIKIKH